MEKIEFISFIKAIDFKIRCFEKRRAIVIKDYIAQKREFADGDRVVIEIKNGRTFDVYIHSCNMFTHSGDIYYRFNKTTNSGTMSNAVFSLSDHGFEYDDIKSITLKK